MAGAGAAFLRSAASKIVRAPPRLLVQEGLQHHGRRLLGRGPSYRLSSYSTSGASTPPPTNHMPARYFNKFPCSHADAKTRLATIGMPSTIMNGMKPDFLYFAQGVKRTFSSSASKSNNHKTAMEAEMAARQAQDAACKPKPLSDESINKDLSSIIAMMAFTSAGVLYLERERRDSLESERRDSRSSRCLNCRNCPCQGRNPKVQQD